VCPPALLPAVATNRGGDLDAQPKPTASDAADASWVVGRFWEALSQDDDLAILQVTASTIHEEIGVGPGVAERVRRAFGVAPERAATIGVSSKVRGIDGVMVFMCVDTAEHPGLIGNLGPELVEGWAIWTAVQGGRWVVAGRYPTSPGGWPPGTEYIDLPHAPPPEPTH
jgi:hypothetical protein